MVLNKMSLSFLVGFVTLIFIAMATIAFLGWWGEKSETIRAGDLPERQENVESN